MLLLAIAFAIVNVPEPNVTLPPVEPPPASDAMLLLKLLRFNVVLAALASVTALLLEKEFAAPAWKVLPALTLVAPE